MIILLLVLAYGLIAGASVAGLMIAAYRLDEFDYPGGFVACGAFWPIALLPAVGYLFAVWWNECRDDDN